MTLGHPMEQWPTLDEMYGCVDCKHVFRSAEIGRCSHCNSPSILNLASLLAVGVDAYRDALAKVFAGARRDLKTKPKKATAVAQASDSPTVSRSTGSGPAAKPEFIEGGDAQK